MPGWQALDAARDAAFARHVAEREIVVQGVQIDRVRAGEGLELGGEFEPSGRLPVVQRLLARAITRQVQAWWTSATALVVEREGEHAIEPLEAVLAPLPPRGEQHLGIATGGERVPERLQLRTQRPEVVDLAVEHDGQLAGGVQHRLVSGRAQVDHRQAPVGEGDPAVGR